MSASKPWQDSGPYGRGKYLLDTGIMADCNFMVGEGTQARRFDCHKIILIAASPVFETMFCGGFEEARSNTVTITDATPDVFRIFLEFIYDPYHAARLERDEICSEYSDGKDYRKNNSNSRIDGLNEKFKNYNFDTLKNLLYLGNKFMIKTLGWQCSLALNQKLLKADKECILKIFELAVATGHRGLAMKSVQKFESQGNRMLSAAEVICDWDASILCEFIKCLKSMPSLEVLKTIATYIERNNLNVDADLTLSSPSSSSTTATSTSARQQKDVDLALPNVGENIKNDKHAHCSTKRGSSSGNGSSSSSSSLSKKPRTDKANDYVEPTSSKSSNSSSNNCSHSFNTSDSGLGNSNTATSSTNTSTTHSSDKARNFEIIKQLYESVNFMDMGAIAFVEAAKKPCLAKYMSYRRKYEIMEKLVKSRCFYYTK